MAARRSPAGDPKVFNNDADFERDANSSKVMSHVIGRQEGRRELKDFIYLDNGVALFMLQIYFCSWVLDPTGAIS